MTCSVNVNVETRTSAEADESSRLKDPDVASLPTEGIDIWLYGTPSILNPSEISEVEIEASVAWLGLA